MVFVSFIWASNVAAADFEIKRETPLAAADRGSGKCQIALDGRIAPGDVEKLSEIYERLSPPLLVGDPYWGQAGDGFDICLNSPGGSLSEGIALARFFREKGIGTFVAEGAECVSACAIAFFGGSIFIDGRFDSYSISKLGKLGVHAPALILNSNLSQLPSDALNQAVNTAYRAAIADIRDVSSVLVQPEAGVSSLDPGLFIQMLATPPDEVFYVDTINKAGLYGVPVNAEGLNVPLTRDVLIRGCDNMLNWVEDLPSGEYDNSAFFLENLNISKVQDPRARTNEEVWKFQEIATFGGVARDSECIFFITKGAGSLDGSNLRVEVFNSRANDGAFYYRVPPWWLMDANLPLNQLP